MLDAYTGEKRPAGPAGESVDAGVHVMGRLVGKYLCASPVWPVETAWSLPWDHLLAIT